MDRREATDIATTLPCSKVSAIAQALTATRIWLRCTGHGVHGCGVGRELSPSKDGAVTCHQNGRMQRQADFGRGLPWVVLHHVSTNDLGIESRFAYRNFSYYWAEKNWRIVLKKLDKRAGKPGVPFSQDNITRSQYNITRAHAMAQIKKQFAKQPSSEKESANYQSLQAGHKKAMSGHRKKGKHCAGARKQRHSPTSNPPVLASPGAVQDPALSPGFCMCRFPYTQRRPAVTLTLTSAAVLPTVWNHQHLHGLFPDKR